MLRVEYKVDPHQNTSDLDLDHLQNISGDKNISILHLSCRMSDLQFSLVMSFKHMDLSFKSICNREHKGVI